MAQRDYVRKKSKPKNNSRIIPNLMMAIAVLLVILFAAILYFVSTNKPNKPIKPTPTVTEKPQTTLPDKPQDRWTYLKELENPDNSQGTNATTKPSEQNTERQKALEDFMSDKPQPQSLLQNKTTQTTQTSTTTPAQPSANTTTQPTQINPIAATPVANDADSWLLQCGAFKEKPNAESLKAKLAMFGVTSTIKSGKFHRVIAGPYSSKAEAKKASVALTKNGVSNCTPVLK